MADSLRDQLLKSGIVKQVQPARVRDEKRTAPSKSAPSKNPGKPANQGARPGPSSRAAKPAGRDQGEIDLARAYSMRAQTEAGERKRAEHEATEQARLRRESKLKIKQLLDGNVLNSADAHQPRHFEHAGKIRRVHVDAAQLAAVNAGRLGVVQQNGRYLLVSREVAEQVRLVDPKLLALLIDPGSSSQDDDGVPDDLIW